MTNKEQLREEFEKTKGSASWISADIYPNGRVFTNDYVEFLEYEIEKGNNAFKKWIIEKLEEGKKIAANEIGNLEAKIQELEAANKEHAIEFAEYLLNDFEMVSEDDSLAGIMLWELAGTHQRYTSEQIHKEWLENQRG